MFTNNYKIYIKSDRWKRKRQQAFKYYGRKCQVCGTSKRLEVNHLTYARLMNETMEDLSILCHEHHRQYTQLRRKMNRRRYTGRQVLAIVKKHYKG